LRAVEIFHLKEFYERYKYPFFTQYERLRSQASAMKEKYEEKILELKEELDAKGESGSLGKENIVDEVIGGANLLFVLRLFYLHSCIPPLSHDRTKQS